VQLQTIRNTDTVPHPEWIKAAACYAAYVGQSVRSVSGAKGRMSCMLDAELRRANMSTRTVDRAQAYLRGDRRGMFGALAFVGPALVASIASMDPGNLATNIQAGARYGYTLLWVVLAANLIAMLFQALSAKLGIVTGHNLAEMCRLHFPRAVIWPMWAISEFAAMATDLAEFLGGAIGLSLLFKIPLMAGMAITAIITYAILLLDQRGFRPLEIVISALVGVIALCYLAEVFIAPIEWGTAAYHTFVPGIADQNALLIAVGIIGATVMPHAVYLHSGLTQARTPPRDEDEARTLVRLSNYEVMIALTGAGLVNMAMVMMASSAFHAGHPDVAEIESAYHTLTPLLGVGAAALFLASLIASGISSSVVGTLAGQMIMQGFVGFRIPMWVRRLVTMAPAFVVVALGVNATQALVVSQVVLSIALPFPMIALLIFSSRADIMGTCVNPRLVTIVASTAMIVVLILNLVLIAQTLGVPLPGLPA
jgi:manganese transport protein